MGRITLFALFAGLTLILPVRTIIEMRATDASGGAPAPPGETKAIVTTAGGTDTPETDDKTDVSKTVGATSTVTTTAASSKADNSEAATVFSNDATATVNNDATTAAGSEATTAFNSDATAAAGNETTAAVINTTTETAASDAVTVKTDPGEVLTTSAAPASDGDTKLVSPNENIVITISAVGDCTIGFDETFGYQNRFDQVYDDNNGDPAYFFENVRDIFENDDLTIANLETVFTESTKKASKTYRFKGPPEYVRILEEGGVEAVNVANNHMFDYFQKGYDDTVATLNNSTVRHFGYETYHIEEIRGVRVGMAGFHIGAGGWSDKKKAITAAIETLRGQSDLVVISFHWGIEGQYKPSGDQRSLAKYSIDTGADLVLGHHTHTLQPIETYEGRTIAYSLGNFCFGGNRNPKDKDSVILRQSFEFDGASFELTGVNEPEIIPVSVSSVQNRNDYKPTPVDGAAAERVMKKVLG